MIKNFRNLLALILELVIIGMWIIQGMSIVAMPGEVIGASIAVFTLIAQFYFRKKPDSEPETT